MLIGSKYIDTDMMSSNMLEAENKVSTVDVEEITVDNIEEISSNADDLLSAKKNIAEDEEVKKGDNERY